MNKILAGDKQAWDKFVIQYSDWFYWKAKEWTWRPEKGGYDEDEMRDAYVWIVEQMKDKISKYKGINNAKLSTFVWAVLNRNWLFVNFMRKKYGQFKVPLYYKKMPQVYSNVFKRMCWRKRIEKISAELKLTIYAVYDIYDILLEKSRNKKTTEKLISWKEYNHYCLEINTIEEPSISYEDQMTLQNIIVKFFQAFQMLHTNKQLLLRLYYKTELTREELLETFNNTEKSFPGFSRNDLITLKDVSDILCNIRFEVVEHLRELTIDYEDVDITEKTVIVFLEDDQIRMQL